MWTVGAVTCIGASLSFTVGVVQATSPSTEPVEIGTAAQIAANAPFADDAEPVAYDRPVDVLAAYVVGDGHLEPTDHGIDPAHEALWERITRVVPAGWSDRFVQLSVIEEQPGSIVAIVHRSSRAPDTWILSVDRADLATPDLLEHTLLHEVGHLVSFASSDFEFSRGECADDWIAMELGCGRPGSILTEWSQRFWSEPAPFQADTHTTHYAASSSHEDFAETFMAWLVGSPAEPRTVLADKFSFMDQRPELLALRDELTAHGALS